MDGTTVLFYFSFAAFCFLFVFWMKKTENKHKYKKTKMVEQIINKKNIHVDQLYIGSYFDLINDTKNRHIWFFTLQNSTLQYKQIPYDELFQVTLKLDGHIIEEATRTGELRRKLLGGEMEKSTSLPATTWKKENDLRAVKEVQLTIQMDDLKATTLDLLFTSSYLPVDRKHVKDKDAKEWFAILKNIIENEERKRA